MRESTTTSEMRNMHSESLDGAEWIASAEWLANPGAGLPVFTTRFEVARVAPTQLHLAVGGVATVRVNGSKVTEHVLEPGYSDYASVTEVTVYDITAFVRQGINDVVIAIGPGMYRSLTVDGRWAKLNTDFGDLAVRAAIVQPSTTDGGVLCATGICWATRFGGTVRSNWTGGEDYDDKRALEMASREIDGWPRAVLAPRPPAGDLVERSSMGLHVCEKIAAVSVSLTPAGTLAVDFGTNIAGWPVIAVPSDVDLTITPAELRHPDGVVDPRTEGWGPVFHTVTTGESGVMWHPQFMYNGFRYLEIQGLESASPDMFEAWVIAADVPQSGHFVCADPMLAKINDLITRAVRSNAFSVFTDCPQREKLGYLEQLHLVFDCIVRNLAAQPILTRTVDLMVQAQRFDGSIALYVPEWEEFPEPWKDDINWGGAIGFLPWELYREYGDRAVLERAYPALQRYLKFTRRSAVDGILHRGLGDWNGHGFRYVPLVASATWFRLLRVASSIARTLGLADDTAAWSSEADTVRDTIRARLIDGRGTVGSGTVAELAVAIDAGLIDEADGSQHVDELENLIRQAGYSIDIGEVAMSALVSVLRLHRRGETLLRMCHVTDRPGYGYMVAHGATALTETWDGPTFGYSQNHFMNGAIASWFSRGLLGIDQEDDSTGYRAILIRPEVVPELGSVCGWVDTVVGRIEAGWRIDGDDVVVEGCLPGDTSGVLELPSGQRKDVRGPFTFTERLSFT